MLTKEGLPTSPPGVEERKAGTRVIHSSQYKKREEFKGRKVVILGVSHYVVLVRVETDEGKQIGETSMDLSYEAIKGGAEEVVVCHRGGWLSFPKVLNDFQVFGVKFDGDLPIDGLVSPSLSLL